MVWPVRPELVEGSGKFLEAQGGMAVAALDEKLFLSSLVFALLGFWRARAYKLAQSRVADHAGFIQAHCVLFSQSFSRENLLKNVCSCSNSVDWTHFNDAGCNNNGKIISVLICKIIKICIYVSLMIKKYIWYDTESASTIFRNTE